MLALLIFLSEKSLGPLHHTIYKLSLIDSKDQVVEDITIKIFFKHLRKYLYNLWLEMQS